MNIEDIAIYPLPIVTDINKIQPGQAIRCEYKATAGKYGVFSNLGTAEKDLITLPATSADIDGAFFFICVGYTPDGALKLIADRNIQNFISWETLNTAGLCTSEGLDLTAGDLSPHQSYRLLSSDEWDAILVNYDLEGLLTDTAATYHTGDSPSWVLDTALGAPANRVIRGGAMVDSKAEMISTGNAGFRPVLIYNPVPKIAHRPDEETTCPLSLVKDIKRIQPGQAISCEYVATANAVGTFSNLGHAGKKHISDLAPEEADGTFYFICVGYTPAGELKLVADRNIQGKISWETLNDAGFCTYAGGTANIDNIGDTRIRLMGSVSNRLIDEQGYGEWDAIISHYDLGGAIEPSDNAVWNCLSAKSWTLSTLSTVDEAGAAADPALRIARGGQDKDSTVLQQSKYDSSDKMEYIGFRPVLIYNPVPKIVHRPDEETTCPLPLVTDIKRIQPGQAISCEYVATANAVGTFSNLGHAGKKHISDLAPEEPDGTFYFICVGYTPAGELKLVADRNIQGKISWETLNDAGFCTSAGSAANIDYIGGMRMRLPGTISDRLVDDENHGEWDAIISDYDLGGVIHPSDNTVWNCLLARSWTLSTLSTVDEAGTAADSTLRIARGGQDKDHIVLRQSKYDSNDTVEYVGFRPVLTVKSESRFLYLKEDYTCYTVDVNGVLEKVTDDWQALREAEKNELFREKGSGVIALASVLQELGKFKILVLAVGKAEKPAIFISSLPWEKMILPAGLINIERFKSIDQVNMKDISDGAGKCAIAVTTDLQNYKVYRGGIWEAIDIKDLTAVSEKGMNAREIGVIPKNQWKALTHGKAGVAFAYFLTMNSTTDKAEVDELAMRAELKGHWQVSIGAAK